MRLFVALVPPDDALEHLAAHVEPRREAGAELRWTDPHQWHVTLAFLGAVPERSLDALTDALASVASRRDPLVLRLSGAGVFPNAYAARVLWAGVEVLQGDLAALARATRGAANGVGATPDGARFHPHVTLGRFPRPAEATRWLRAFDVYEGPTWRADEVVLVESHLGEGRGRRPRYEVLARLALGRPAD